MAVLVLLHHAVRPHATWREQTVDETNFSFSQISQGQPPACAGSPGNQAAYLWPSTGGHRHQATRLDAEQDEGPTAIEPSQTRQRPQACPRRRCAV